MPLLIKALKTAEEIREHRALWNWPGSRESDLDFFLYFAGARAEVVRPQVLVVYRDDTPEAMLIGKLEIKQIPIRVGWLSFRTARLRVLNIVYGGLRGSTARDCTEALVKEALKTVRRGEVDVAVFEPLTTDSHLGRSLEELAERFERGFRCPQHTHYRMQLPESSQELHATIAAKEKQNYLRKGRKLVRDFSGDVSRRWYRQACPDVYRDLEFIAERSFQRGLGVGFQDTPELRGWWELAGSKGCLRVCILYVGGKPCAFWTGVAYSGTLWGDYMAYDRQFAAYSPGMYLLLRSFEELCDKREEHGIREISLGPGDSHLKSLLSSSHEQENSVYIYAPTLQGVVRNLIFSFVFLVDESARKWAARTRFGKVASRMRREHASRNAISQA